MSAAGAESRLRENPFEIAQSQLRNVGEIFALDPNLIRVLSQCKKAVEVSIPVSMDDGSIGVFKGFRVTHNIARGPSKGAIRGPQQTVADFDAFQTISWDGQTLIIGNAFCNPAAPGSSFCQGQLYPNTANDGYSFVLSNVPVPAAAWLFFVGTLVPALGFTNVFPMRFSFVADHFQYPAIAFPLAAAASLEAVAAVREPRIRLAAPVILLVLGVLTFRQTAQYRDEETLWRATLERNPGSWMAHVNLGKLLHESGRAGEALEHLLAAASLPRPCLGLPPGPALPEGGP